MSTLPFRFLRRLLLPALAVLAFGSPLQAQAKFYGFTAGATLSDFSDYYGGISTGSRWGGTAGLIFGVRTANWAAIALEPAWVMAGSEDVSIGYIEVPLTFGGVARDRNDTMRYGAYTGIAPAFKISCNDDESLVGRVCDDADGTIWWLPVGLRFLRRTSGTSYVGIDVKYNFPLGGSFGSVASQRTWAFRLIFLKGGAAQ